MKRSRRYWYGIGIAAILVVSLLCARQWMRPKSLLEQSTPITDTKEWGLLVSPGPRSNGINYGGLFRGTAYHWSSAYQWLDREKILFFRHGPTFSTWSDSDNYYYGGIAVVYDCATRQSKDLTQFNSHFVSSKGNPYWTKAAPDGNWILWSQGWQREGGLRAATRDGQHYMHCPTEGELYWLESGQSLVEYLPDDTTHHPHLTIRSIQNPAKQKKILLRDFPEDSIIEAVSPDRHLYAIHFETDSAKLEYADTLTVLDQDFQHEAGKLSSYPIRFPAGLWVKEVVFLPSKHKIAWLLSSEGTSPLEKVFRRVFPGHIPDSHITERLWISSLDGKNRREIGRAEIKQGHAEITSGDQGVYFLRWVPDGTRLSFVYKDSLYTVPAD